MRAPAAKGARLAVLLLVVCVGLGMRACWAAQGPTLQGDAGSRYLPEAQRILSKAPLSVSSPEDVDYNAGYPYFLALLLFLSGGSHWAVLVVHFALEIATVGLVLLLWNALRLPSAGRLVVGALALLCPFPSMFARALLTETVATLLACGALLAAVKAVTGRSWPWALAMGALLGLGLNVRADSLPYVALLPVASGCAAWASHERGARGLARLVVLPWLVALLTLAPVTIRNYRALGSWRPLGPVSAQVRLAYARWLDVWLDDPSYFERAWWRVLSPASHPIGAEPLPADERLAAEQALEQLAGAGHGGCVPPMSCFYRAFDSATEARFVELRARALERRPFTVLVVVPARRAFLTWLRLPIYYPRGALKVVVYLGWGAVLAACGLGLAVAIRTRAALLLIPASLMLARTALPLLTALGVEPRYMLPALPACFVFAAIGIQSLAGGIGKPRRG